MNEAYMTMPSGIRPTDLVLEMQRRRRASARANAVLHRRRRRSTVLQSTAVVAVALLLAGVGKLTFDYVRVDRALTSAQAQVAEQSPESLALAAVWLEEGLEVDPDDSDALAMMAFVRAQQAIDGSIPLEEAQTALDGVEDEPRGVVARAIVEILAGRADHAESLVGSLEPEQLDTPSLLRAQAWVQGMIELSQLGEPARLDAAIAAIDAARDEANGWDRTHRVAAGLFVRAGRLDQARARLDEAQRLRPEDTGIEVDRALFDAVSTTAFDDIQVRLDALRKDPSLQPRDAARARVAAGMLALRRADRGASAQLDEAVGALGPEDGLARILALEVALRHGERDVASRWLEDGTLPQNAVAVHRAWIDLVDDEPESSLRTLGELPQAAPSVSMLQGLALVEQGRYVEAKPRLDRATGAFPGRPLLRVAQARTEAALGNPGRAVEQLEAFARRYPDASRVWTGLAEALVAAEGGRVPASAVKPLRQALEREPEPARAAFLLGLRLRDASADDPSQITESIELLRRAAELRPWVPLHRETLGRMLADVGDRAEALELLRGVADSSSTSAASLLVMAELAAEQAVLGGESLPAEREQWLEAAQLRGATPDALVHARARTEMRAGTREDLTRVRASIGSWLREHPKDLEARLIHVEALRRLGDLDGARASVRQGIRRSRRQPLGRLMLAWAEIERDAGKERRAASMASRGWTMSVRERRPANELLGSAALALDAWRVVDHQGSALLVGRQLTRRVPHRAEAWALRSRVQLETEHPGPACTSARRAVSLDPTLPDAQRALAECSAALHDTEAEREARSALASLVASG